MLLMYLTFVLDIWLYSRNAKGKKIFILSFFAHAWPQYSSITLIHEWISPLLQTPLTKRVSKLFSMCFLRSTWSGLTPQCSVGEQCKPTSVCRWKSLYFHSVSSYTTVPTPSHLEWCELTQLLFLSCCFRGAELLCLTQRFSRKPQRMSIIYLSTSEQT